MPLSSSPLPSFISPAEDVVTWLKRALGEPAADVHVKLRGNILHVLCETAQELDQTTALLNLVRGLLESTEAGALVKAYPQLYQLYVYNRIFGERTPHWTAPIYLNRLERHLAQLVLESQDAADIKATQELLQAYTGGDAEALRAYAEDGAGGAIVLSNLSLARKGDPDAIAWYLSETLSSLDVGVIVRIRAIPGKAHLQRLAITAKTPPLETLAPSQEGNATISRLWILCEATYSPDPALIAQPTAERLRQLQLSQYKDAVLLLQVRGEQRPDWSLRIDLTPKAEMLREWARWGDSEAIARLATLALTPLGLQGTAEVKLPTLHLMVQPQADSAIADWPQVESLLAPLLSELAPQGLHRAMVYGQLPESDEPAWVGCLELPASEHPALADPPEVLARQGDLPATAFVLTRLLNPHLEEHLATGGLRVQLLVRDQLLHIMVDGPVAPRRQGVAKAVTYCLQGFKPAGIEGLRIYGRRSGESQPHWSYGKDFVARGNRLVPEAAPEFTASESYVNELLTPPEAPVLRTDLDHDETVSASKGWSTGLLQNIRQGLLRSNLFTPYQAGDALQPASYSGSDSPEGLKIALVWGAVGLLLALQTDWLLGQVLNPPTSPGAAEATTVPEATPTPTPYPQNSFEDAFANLDWGEHGTQAGTDETETAAATPAEEDSPFVAEPMDLPTSPDQPIIATEELLSASPYPSFRSQQLDEKLALYYQHLEQSGPPDVVVVGSSRALRGVDPAALHKELDSLGYKDVSVFNFGVNGATAQVVELLIRRILKPSQLPKLIVWADGARAFNSGRVDVTYNAITTSEGYRELVNGRLDVGASAPGDAEAQADAVSESTALGADLSSSYQVMDTWLSDQLASFSAVFPERERLKTAIQQGLSTIADPFTSDQQQVNEKLDAPIPEGSIIDFDGFLALSLRFNPATYYQDYARVPGLYDGDYEDFRLEGRQDEAFRELLSFTQKEQIPIVFVNTPLSDEYLDDYREEAETAFQRYMLRLSANEPGLIFRDLGKVWLERYDYFSDPSHLNRYGAYQVSNKLARDPMIPWPHAASN